MRDEAFELGGARPFATRGPTMREGVGLKSGALLVREWNNRLERVMVLDDGYAWNGGVYRSLSQLAKAITGTSWNGHRFFGLKAVRNGASSRRRSAAPRPNPLLDTGMPTLAAFAPASVDRSLPLATKEAKCGLALGLGLDGSDAFWPFEGGTLELSGVFGGRPSLASSSATRAVSAATCATNVWISASFCSCESNERSGPADMDPWIQIRRPRATSFQPLVNSPHLSRKISRG